MIRSRIVLVVSALVAGLLVNVTTHAPGANAAAAVPSTPFVADVSPTGLGMQVTWVPNPAADAVTSYSVTVKPKSTTAVNGCTPATVTKSAPATDTQLIVSGLCAVALYQASVRAVNAAGTSAAGTTGTYVAPLVAQVPDSPAVTSTSTRAAAVTVTWLAPADNGGKPITGYTATATPTTAAAGTPPTATVSTSATIFTATLTGLTNGTDYTLRITARNTVGTSIAATAQATPRPAYAPVAPTGLTVTPSGTGAVVVSWAVPPDDGGRTLTGYTVTWQLATYDPTTTTWSVAPGSTARSATVAPSVLSYTVAAASFPRLDAFYLFTVAATNGIGTGPAAATPAGVSPTVSTTTATQVLTPATLRALTAVTATTLSWTNPAPAQVATLKKGQVLVAGSTSALAPDGFLRTVAAIAGAGGGAGTKTVVTTTSAALPDVFTTAGLATSTNPLSSAGQPGATPSSVRTNRPKVVPNAPGVSVIPDAGISYNQSVTASIDYTTGPLTVKGSFTITPSVEVDLGLAHGIFGIPDGIVLKSSASLTAQAQLSVTGTAEKQIPVVTITGDPIEFPVFGVPVVIVPKVVLYLVISGALGVTFGFTTEVGASLAWDSRHPTSLDTKNLSKAPQLQAGPYGLEQTLVGLVGIGIRLEAQIYDLAGPTVSGELDLQIKLTVVNGANGSVTIQIGPQVKLKAGLDLDILGFGGQVNITLAVFNFSQYVVHLPPPAYYTISPDPASVQPGNSVQFSAVRSDGVVVSTTWSLLGQGPGDVISAAGRFTAGPVANRVLVVQVSDASGADGSAHVAVGVIFDPPAHLAATADSAGAAHITWSPPARTGGAAISNYVVATTPGTGTHTVGAGITSLIIPGLGPGSFVDVYAVNAIGLHSPGASTQVQSPSQVVAIASGVGAHNACALLANGAVRCWGDDTYGALGDGRGNDLSGGQTQVVATTAVDVIGISTAVAISVGAYHSCALLANGTIRCWGYDGTGQLGDGGGASFRTTPVAVAGIANAVAVSAGNGHSCATLADHTMRCWGYDGHGELGDGTTGDANGERLSPATVRGLGVATSAVTTGNDTTCSAGSDGVPRCWGDDYYGQLGDGNDYIYNGVDKQTAPVAQRGIANATAVSAGYSFTCTQLADGSVRCAGANGEGELGRGSTQYSNTPVAVAGIGTADAIAAGGSSAGGHACALLSGGSLRCWGADSSGQLGDGTTGDANHVRLSPVAVTGLGTATAVTAQSASTCALLTDHTVRCWGFDGNGELGDGSRGGTTGYRLTPVTVQGL